MKLTWEMYEDITYYDMYAVRPTGDTSFVSPRLFHFAKREDAENFKELVERAHCAIPENVPDQNICEWSEDEDGNWDTKCGEKHVFFDGGPSANNHMYCPYCGKRIVEQRYTEEPLI